MLDSIRNQKRLLFGVMLLLILPSFVFFGVQGYQQFLTGSDAVATVDGVAITQREFDEALRRHLDQLRQSFGGSVDPRLLDNPQTRREVLDGLIAQRALAREAAGARMTVTDAQLAQAIADTPGLRKDDGSFDLERYRSVLAAQGLSEPMFEAQMRRDLAVQALPDAVARSTIVPKTVAERLAAIAAQVREVREERFAPAAFADQVKPTPEQLKQYYEANVQRFETPESARIEYVTLSADAVAAQVQVPVEELRAYYEQNKARYATAEQRRASHILLRVDEGVSAEQKKAARDKAEQLLTQVRAEPARFAEIARKESQDPGSAAQGGDLGFFTRDTMVEPFADAAWALAPGQMSGVVETPFGYHIVRLAEVRPGEQKTFEQARPEIEAEVRKQLASKRFAETAEAFSNLVEDQSDSLKPAAERFGLTLRTAEVGRQPQPDLPARSPLASPKLLGAVFADETLRGGRNTAALDVAPNTLVAARVVEHRPVPRKPFEAVADEVRQAVASEQARRLAAEAGQARLKALREAGAALGSMPAAKPVSRTEPAGLPAPALDAVFRADAAKLPTFVGVDLGEQGYGVYAVESVREGAQDEAAKARSAQIAQRLAQVVSQQEQLDYIDAVKADAKVSQHPERIVSREPR